MTILDFQRRKDVGEKISMLTCYDYWSARILNQSPVDCLLVGDSLVMVMHGRESTIPARTGLMALHTRAVCRGAPDKFVIADMPFLSYRKGLLDTMNQVERLMRAGANAVKLEGIAGHRQIIAHLVQSGIPVMGHLGLTPQSIQALGSFKVQGRDEEAGKALLEQARALEEAGCFALVLECVPRAVARQITRGVSIPTIGIGAGVDCDGQVLVLQDLLGLNPDFRPKFVRRYLEGARLIGEAVDRFHQEVREESFPTDRESYR